MLSAIFIIFASVLAGTVLALVPRGRQAWMGPIRTFALTAALAVVVLHLLPEALTRVGWGAILAFFAGLLLPESLGKLAVFLWRAAKQEPQHDDPERRRDFALEASYFGLLVHRLGDGIGLGAFAGELIGSPGRGGVITALAAHAVPVVAIVVLTFDSVRGRGHAVKRAVGLALASVVGVLLAHSVPTEVFALASAWIAAFVGGTLIHVVSHDLGVQLPKTTGHKLWDLGAGALGLYVSYLGRGAHHHDHASEAGGHFEEELLHFSVQAGPILILGLVLGALVTALGPRIPARLFRRGGVVPGAAWGAILGAPLPLLAGRILPTTSGLKARGVAPSLLIAFLLSTPALGVETFALSARFLGWKFALVRLVAAVACAFGAAVVVGVLLRRAPLLPEQHEDLRVPVDGAFPRRFLSAFDELFHQVGAWMILGLLGAALLQVGLSSDAFHNVKGSVAQFLVISLVAVPAYVCAPAATPLAAVLLAKGMSPGAVLLGLLLGPATNVATLVFLRRSFGLRVATLGVFAVVVFSFCFGFLLNSLWEPSFRVPLSAHEAEVSGLSKWAAAGAGLLLLRGLFVSGVRGFLSTLGGEHAHGHDGGDAHGHVH